MRLIRILLVAVAAVVVGLVVLVVVLPGEKIAQLAADQVKARTGRDLSFSGEVGISWYPVFGVSTGPVSLGNASWSDARPMFEAESLSIGVDVMSALSGDIRIKGIEAVGPSVLLEKAANGQVNWDLFGTSTAGADGTDESANGSSGEVSSPHISLEGLNISQAQLRYVDHAGESFEMKDIDLKLTWPEGGGAAQADMTLRPAAEDVRITAAIGNMDDFLQGAVSTVKASVSTNGGQVDFDGRASTAPEAAGRVIADIAQPGAFLAAMGTGGAVDGPLQFEGDVTFTKDQLFSLRKGAIFALGNSLNAEADVDLSGAKPIVRANVSAQSLRLSGSSGESGTDGTSTANGTGWSKEQIDASALGLVDGQIQFGAETIEFGDHKVGRTRASISIENARAVATLSELVAYDGMITGKFIANNRKGFSVRGDLNIKQIALKDVLSSAAGLDKFTGKADVTSRFLGSGASVHAIMNSLSGDGTASVGRGTIEGIDLDKLFRGDPTGGTTVFDKMTASWTIEKGVLSNPDLLMELPRIVAKGAGRVGLGQRVIDYTFTPQLRSDDGSGLAVPVKIEGSWDAPSIAPDMDALLKQNLDKERKALEEEAKKRLEEELGIQKEEGQSTEDAVIKRLEEEATKSLRNLLGNN